jgi:hypothetical protein
MEARPDGQHRRSPTQHLGLADERPEPARAAADARPLPPCTADEWTPRVSRLLPSTVTESDTNTVTTVSPPHKSGFPTRIRCFGAIREKP